MAAGCVRKQLQLSSRQVEFKLDEALFMLLPFFKLFQDLNSTHVRSCDACRIFYLLRLSTLGICINCVGPRFDDSVYVYLS